MLILVANASTNNNYHKKELEPQVEQRFPAKMYDNLKDNQTNYKNNVVLQGWRKNVKQLPNEINVC